MALAALAVGLLLWTGTSAEAKLITAQGIVELVNESRIKESLSPLLENARLSKAAAAKAEDMLQQDYFAHTAPSGKTPWFWIDKSGYNYQKAGENLAMNFTSVEAEHQAWMKSPLHQKNILNADFQEIGVAVKKGKIAGRETTVAVQMFGSRRDFVAPATAPEKNKPVAVAPSQAAGQVLGQASVPINLVATERMDLANSLEQGSRGIVSYLKDLQQSVGQLNWLEVAQALAWLILFGIMATNTAILLYLAFHRSALVGRLIGQKK